MGIVTQPYNAFCWHEGKEQQQKSVSEQLKYLLLTSNPHSNNIYGVRICLQTKDGASTRDVVQRTGEWPRYIIKEFVVKLCSVAWQLQ